MTKHGIFSEGLANISKDGKTGQIVVPYQFDEVLKNFEDGAAIVECFGEEFRINKKGEMIVTEEIPPAGGKGRE